MLDFYCLPYLVYKSSIERTIAHPLALQIVPQLLHMYSDTPSDRASNIDNPVFFAQLSDPVLTLYTSFTLITDESLFSWCYLGRKAQYERHGWQQSSKDLDGLCSPRTACRTRNMHLGPEEPQVSGFICTVFQCKILKRNVVRVSFSSQRSFAGHLRYVYCCCSSPGASG